MTRNDTINGLFELAGAYFTWRNYIQLRRDRALAGVFWPMVAFMTAWGVWNLWYYPSLDQWLSLGGALVLVGGNACWTALAIKLWWRSRRARLA